MRLPGPRWRFAGDRRVIALMVIVALLAAAATWLAKSPGDEPVLSLDLPELVAGGAFAPQPVDPARCRAELRRSGVAFKSLPPAGEGPCLRIDRVRLTASALSPAPPVTTCPVAAGLEEWLRESVQPAARTYLGGRVVGLQNVGAFSCRRRGGSPEAEWSEHATANAIDIGGFMLEDGRSVSVLDDWNGAPGAAAFLRVVRDGACRSFGTVLSPAYDEAHADHLHLDQTPRRYGALCE